MIKVASCWLLCVAAYLICIPAKAAEALPPGVTLTQLENVKWVKTISGREQAYIMGHPSKPALFQQ